jgi:proteic killer suppression protein
VIRSFKSKDLAAFFSGNIPIGLRPLEPQLSRRLQILDSATSTGALAGLRSNHFEALKGDRKGQYSIRVNIQWRLCFRFEGEDAYDVELVDCH